MGEAIHNQAKDPEKYDRMVKVMSECESKEDMTLWVVMYIKDEAYARPDIHLALKAVEKEKGWTSL